MVGSIITILKGNLTGPCYDQSDKNVTKNIAYEDLNEIVKFLGKNDFFVGSYITWVDLYFLELLDLIEFLSDGDVWTSYPTLKPYYERLINIPNIKSFRTSDRFYKRPFNNSQAKINN